MTRYAMIRQRLSGTLTGAITLALGLTLFGAAGAQEDLALRTSSGPLTPGIVLSTHRGYAAFPARDLVRLGWEVTEEEGMAVIRWAAKDLRVEVLPEIPFLRWGADGVHLADPPYRAEGQTFLPVQFLVDVLPWKLPDRFDYRAGSWVLDIMGPAEAASSRAAAAPRRLPDPTRVVVIDAGHGGRDPGTVGQRGTQEKEVALGIATALARMLEGEENVEVHLTRDDDTLVPIWKRGEQATDWKKDRAGVFISIHANALPGSPATRGFETYFLSEARTEHERRVAALENAALGLEEEEGAPEQVQDMSFILTELRTLDHQHWSALLAEFIQGELAEVHPGPNRGVKQGPFAVITNTLMPAVLVEVGFLSNRDEERLLTQRDFQEDAARAVADAVREFLKRYPPGGGG